MKFSSDINTLNTFFQNVLQLYSRKPIHHTFRLNINQCLKVGGLLQFWRERKTETKRESPVLSLQGNGREERESERAREREIKPRHDKHPRPVSPEEKGAVHLTEGLSLRG